MPVRKLGSTSWYRRCKIEGESTEGLVIHSLTTEHQNRTMTLVWNIKRNIYGSDLSSTSTSSIGPELEQEEEDDTTTRVSDNRGDDVEKKVAFPERHGSKFTSSPNANEQIRKHLLCSHPW